MALTNKDLINLIDLSLGVEPQGVVNFNYLHGLMHGIVRRLVDIESHSAHSGKGRGRSSVGLETGGGLYEADEDAQLSRDVAQLSRGDGGVSRDGSQQTGGRGYESSELSKGAQPSKEGVQQSGDDGQVSKGDQPSKEGVQQSRGDGQVSKGDQPSKEGVQQSRGDGQVSKGGQMSKGAQPSKEGVQQSRGDSQVSSDGDQLSKDVGQPSKENAQQSTGDGQVSSDGRGVSKDSAGASTGGARPPSGGARRPSSGGARPSSGGSRIGRDSSVGSAGSAGSGIVSSTPMQSRASVRHQSSQSRPRAPSIVSAANDIGALERKLQELEQRMSSMETLPELLNRVASDSGATPVSDMWNFTNMDKRLTATEEGLGTTSKLVDGLLGEINNLQSRLSNSDDQGRRMSTRVSEELESLQDKLMDLEKHNFAPIPEDSGTEAAALMRELDRKIEIMQSEINKLKNQLAETDFSASEALSSILKEQKGLIEKNESLLMAQSDNLSEVEKSMSESTDTCKKLTGQVGTLEEEVNKILAMAGEMQTSIREKVNASDIASLMPTSSDDSNQASLLPKLLELQTKISALEAQMGAVPQDMQDQVTALRNTADKQSEEISSLANLVRALESKQSSEAPGKFEDFGSQLAQLRERLNELDRAVTALSDHLANLSHHDMEAVTDTDGEKFVDMNSFNVVQGLLAQLQQEHERLMGTAAHLSHELDITKDHVKSLYESMDDVKTNKADKVQVEVEVREKADRKALDDKASREWVDSTFEKLDKEIREARSKMLGQEEALKLAVNQLSEDVDGKLDRMELQPLKDYFEKKFDSAKALPKVQSARESALDDAAGIKKPLRFACLSCDKPVEMKQLGIVPTLPSISTFPGTRSFRPYTTYELEMIRRHQKLLYPLPPIMDIHRGVRSAGGTHTLTRPHQRFRLAPYGGPSVLTTPEHYVNHMTSKSSPLVYEETDIVGQDGQIYKGRVTRKNKPPGGFRRKTRPLTSPHSYKPSHTT